MPSDFAVDALIAQIFAASEHIRYVAVRLRAGLTLRERAGIANASAAESDRYEELLVNPTLVTLLRQRGNIDCGGLQFMLIRYGNFFQLVWPLDDGHVSVAMEPEAASLELVARVRAVIERHLAGA